MDLLKMESDHINFQIFNVQSKPWDGWEDPIISVWSNLSHF